MTSVYPFSSVAEPTGSTSFFDIWRYGYITWDDFADLAKRLQLRIEAVIGRGARALS
jgi:hypothetical protein